MLASAEHEIDLHAEGALGPRRPRGDDAEMDITPMIDITFLLLIFFLVCSTPDQQTAVELPEARYGRGVSERESLIISIGEGGIDTAPVYLADGKIDEAQISDDEIEQRDAIAEAVEKARREENKEHVLIKADRNVAHRDVARVIKAISRVEGAKIHLGVLEAE